MDADEARRVLGVEKGADRDTVMAQFAVKLFERHPDHGGNGDIQEIIEARNVLLAELRGRVCPECKGQRGVFIRANVFVMCKKCNGKGVRDGN